MGKKLKSSVIVLIVIISVLAAFPFVSNLLVFNTFGHLNASTELLKEYGIKDNFKPEPNISFNIYNLQ